MCKENEKADKKIEQKENASENVVPNDAWKYFKRNILFFVAFIIVTIIITLKCRIRFNPFIYCIVVAGLGVVAIILSFLSTYYGQIKNERKNRNEYNKFNQNIRSVILKKNPVECRKEMKKVLEKYCNSQCNDGISEDEVINALIEQYKGRINDNEVYNNIMTIAYAVLVGAYTILANVSPNTNSEISNNLNLILALALIGLALGLFLIYKINIQRSKAGNNGYILAFLENCKEETKANRQSKQEKE